MAVNTRRMNLPAERVWDAIVNGTRYAEWVVGTSTIRDVDAGFPAVRTRIHYTVGRGPIRHEGHTEVLDIDPGSRLVLEAHAWPLGTAVIDLRVTPAGAQQCTVSIDEHPEQGIGRLLHSRVSDAVIKVRNVETLRRLERLAASGQGQAQA